MEQYTTMNEQQQQILIFLYRFRFLNRTQIQSLLHHKYFNRIIVWLNELTKEGYIRRYYNPKTVTVPAMYSLNLKGRKYLLDHPELYPVKLQVLNRVWREKTYTKQLRDHCLFLTDIYLSLSALVETTKATLDFKTKTDLFGMHYLILPNPDAYFSITEKDGSKKRYFLDIFDDQPARMALRKRIKQYLNYYEEEYWQDHAQVPFPAVIFIVPEKRYKTYVVGQIRKQVTTDTDMVFFVTTRGLIREKGISKTTLEKVQAKI